MAKGEFQICPRMDFDKILYIEYLHYGNYKKKEIFLFLEGCKATGGHLDVHPLCTNIWPIKYQSHIINIIDCCILGMEYERGLPRVCLTTINVYEYIYIFFLCPIKIWIIPILNTKVSVYRGFCLNIYHVPVFVNPSYFQKSRSNTSSLCM